MPRLLQFRAGRCLRRGETNMVDPLPAKGLLYIEQSEDDGLSHLCFKDLESDTVVDDLILFSGDATFTPVPSSSASPSRIYVLKFSSSDQRLLYWMQEPDASTDERNARRLNELIEDPGSEEGAGEAMAVDPPASAPATATASEATAAAPAPTALPPSTGPTDPATGSTSAQQARLFHSMLAQYAADQEASEGEGLGGTMMNRPGLFTAYALTDVLTPTSLLPLLSSPSPSLLAALTPYLPQDVPPTKESLVRVVESIEFKRAVGQLDGALRTGALGAFVGALGLPQDAGFGVESYVEAVRKQAAEKKKQAEGSGNNVQTD